MENETEKMEPNSDSSSSTSCISVVKSEQAQGTLPCMLDGKFFVFLESESSSTKKVAVCTSCLPKEVKISGFNNSTSNFVTHLKRKHGEERFMEYQSYLKNVRKDKQSSRTFTANRDCSEELAPVELTASREQSNNEFVFIVQDKQEPESLPCILDGRFFIYCGSESTNTRRVGMCTSCLPKEVKINGFNKSTSNFVTHLKRKHGEEKLEEYQSHLKNMRKSKQFRRTSNSYRQTETGNSSDKPTEEAVSQQDIDVYEYLIVQNKQTLESLPCILDGRFFIYCESESTNTHRVGMCTSCLPKEVKISGFNNSTSNFITHLKRKHGETKFEEYQNYLKTVRKGKQFLRTNCYRQAENNIDCIYERAPAQQTVSQEQFNENILKFFIHSMIPLQTIEDPFLKKLFDYFSVTERGLNIVNRSTLGHLIDEKYSKEISKISTEIQDITDLCTTAFIWLAKPLSILGVSVHWLDSNLQRKSKTLACRRYSGTHSYDRIAVLLKEIHAEFGLDSQKVLATVNYSNFAKLFKEFGVDIECCVNDTNSLENSKAEESFHTEVSFPLNYHNVKYEVDPLGSVDITPQSTLLELPAHLRCCAQKLNVCATDANEVLRRNKTTMYIHNQVIHKCNNLWNLASRPKSDEIIQSIVGHTFSKPEIGRWNSLYDALKQIASIQERTVQLHEALGLANVLNEDDFQYLKEYLLCSKPIAEALDILQGERNMYYGILLPSLVSLRKKLQKLNSEPLSYCQKLAEKYLENVEVRFADFFEFTSEAALKAAISAMAYPRFKDKWLACVSEEYHSGIISIFKAAINKEITVTPKCRYEDSYFKFDSDSSENESNDVQKVQRPNIDDIVSSYLADRDRDVSMLHRYPKIKSVFKKYNTPLPSAGSIEGLFSYATMTNLPMLCRLSDEMFEKRVVLKSNLVRST